MPDTTLLQLPLIAAAQAQKHVTHNDALLRLDALVGLAVIDRDLTTPPGSPADGDRYIPASGATGAWDGWDLGVAVYADGVWTRLTPREGWRAWVADEGALVVFDGTDWVTLETGGGGRELLTAPRTYYVRTDGDDGNDGLSDTAGGAFLTIQKAVDTAAALDLGVHDVAIQIADGTYTGAVALKTLTGAGVVHVVGNVGTPANVLLSVTGAHVFSAGYIAGEYRIRGVKMGTTTSGNAITVTGKAPIVRFESVDFGAVAGVHVDLLNGGTAEATGNYAISGGGVGHWRCNDQGFLRVPGRTIAISGTPAFSGEFARARRTSTIVANGCTFSGSGATGKRFDVQTGSIIFTSGAGATYLPGSTSGTDDTATSGHYV